VVLSFSLCDYVLIEEGTGKASLIGCFDKLAVPDFPSPPQSFFVAAELTGGRGIARVEVRIARPDTDHPIGWARADVRFRDPLFVVRYRTRVTGCVFPVPGRYAISLEIDGELTGQRIIELVPGGSGQ
jgi:hypothetical protein